MSGVTFKPSPHDVVGDPTGAKQPLQIGGSDGGYLRSEPVYYGLCPLEPDATMITRDYRGAVRSRFCDNSSMARPIATGHRQRLKLRWMSRTEAELQTLRDFERIVRKDFSWGLHPNDPSDAVVIQVVFDSDLSARMVGPCIYTIEADVIEVFPR